MVLIENRNPNTLSLNQYHQQTGQKAMSADSILAMFRNFNTAMAMTEMSNYLSASTTPSCSSLQDEVVGSEDESLMSNSAHSPSGGKESPTRYRYSNVIQVSQMMLKYTDYKCICVINKNKYMLLIIIDYKNMFNIKYIVLIKFFNH